jgi:hypothetical protein
MAETLYVYQDANLVKQLKNLLKAGSNAAPAARHAQAIIDQFINGGIRNLKNAGRFTKYGDARIKNCVKFDLVRGYRLVGILLDQGIAFIYVGSHDECDHWIKNNAWLEPNLDKKRNRVVKIREPAPDEIEAQCVLEMDPLESDYDKLVLGDLTEQDLRKIFCGLLKKSPGA